MAVVVAGREVPDGLRSILTPGDTLFLPDQAGDQFAILAKIGQVLPAWAGRARALASEPLRSARLPRLMVVLAHDRPGLPRTLEELETRFLESLRDEVVRVKDVHPGFAEALLFAAMVRCTGADLSRTSLIALADYYQPGNSFLSLLDAGNRRWSVADELTFHDPIHDTIVFHHDELADGVVEAARRLFEPWVTFDDAWLRVALAKLVQLGSPQSSSSRARPGPLVPDLVTGDDVLAATGMQARGDEGRAPSRRRGLSLRQLEAGRLTPAGSEALRSETHAETSEVRMDRTSPKLSLGIPVYNGAAYLAQLFDCLRGQTLTDYEAIISDNASTDATEQICRRVAAADPRFRYQRNARNIGAAPNFNRVFEQATGQYFKWTAHDDLLAPTYLERCVAVLDDDPSVRSVTRRFRSSTPSCGRSATIPSSAATSTSTARPRCCTSRPASRPPAIRPGASTTCCTACG